MDAVHQEDYRGLKIKIEVDEDPTSPRENSNLGHIVAHHSRYNLGDKVDFDLNQFETWDDMACYLEKEKGAVVILPLYMLDHSGIALKTSSFNDCWDSGLVGLVYAMRDDILKEYSTKRITSAIISKVREVLNGEVDDYSQYLNGQVYGYVIEDPAGNHLDSCWGFYGAPDGYVLTEARTAADGVLMDVGEVD